MTVKRVIDVHERVPILQGLPLSLQHLFAMFGATVLVPILTRLDPSVALLTSGIGTLLYILITKGKIPAYLGSSFAFISPIIVASSQWGPGAAMSGAFAAGLIYIVVALIISYVGSDWLDRLLPPAVIGSVVIVIGLGLAGTAVQMAGLSGKNVTLANPDIRVALVTLLVAILASAFLRGFLAVIPILIGIIVGYLYAWFEGIVDFSQLSQAAWFALPHFTTPRFSWPAILLIAPIAVVPITEHIGHLLVTNKVVGRDFTKDPGLHRSLMGDGVATSVAALLGGPPSTTYGENIGVMAITRVYSVWVIGGAAVIAVLLGFVEKVGALIRTIPGPVMGGISILLFGVIASSGLRMLVESGIDYSKKHNLIISSVILVLGIGGAKIAFGQFELHGMALATFVGILLNLILPAPREMDNGEWEAENAGARGNAGTADNAETAKLEAAASGERKK